MQTLELHLSDKLLNVDRVEFEQLREQLCDRIVAFCKHQSNIYVMSDTLVNAKFAELRKLQLDLVSRVVSCLC